LHERLFEEREAELQARVDRRLVRTMTLAPGALAEALAEWDRFQAEVETIDSAPQNSPDSLELMLECDPVDLGTGVTR
jgi:hypothetical protein